MDLTQIYYYNFSRRLKSVLIPAESTGNELIDYIAQDMRVDPAKIRICNHYFKKDLTIEEMGISNRVSLFISGKLLSCQCCFVYSGYSSL